jgi:hypothetical protein
MSDAFFQVSHFSFNLISQSKQFFILIFIILCVMGQPETNLKNKHDRTLTRWQRLIRVNCGRFWAGKVRSIRNGILTLVNYGVVQGADTGTSDAVGFDSIIITPEMVGRRVAVFVAAEYKAGRDQLRKEQINFRNMVVSLGGVHREIRDSEIIEKGFMVDR